MKECEEIWRSVKEYEVVWKEFEGVEECRHQWKRRRWLIRVVGNSLDSRARIDAVLLGLFFSWSEIETRDLFCPIWSTLGPSPCLPHPNYSLFIDFCGVTLVIVRRNVMEHTVTGVKITSAVYQLVLTQRFSYNSIQLYFQTQGPLERKQPTQTIEII